MATKKPTRQLASCLRLLADMLDHASIEEVLDEVESSLAAAHKSIVQRAETRPERGGRSERTGTVDAALSPEQVAGQLSLSMTEFGRDIMSDTEFPTRQALADFARKNGISVSDRDTKPAIRQKLLSKAELRNMDDLIRGEEKKQ